MDLDLLSAVQESAPGATPALIADVLGIVPPAWMADALCIEYADVGDWFLDTRYEAPTLELEVCARCLVRDVCLAFALAERIASGIWGGLTAAERKRLRAR